MKMVDYQDGKLIIDWTLIPDKFNYVAADVDGEVWAFSIKPNFNNNFGGFWDCAKGSFNVSRLDIFPLAIPNPENTLQKRPDK